MDKKGVVMVYKKCIMLCALFVFIFTVAGCETAKGAAQGVACTTDGTVRGAAKDAKGLAGAIMAADEWVRENLW